MKYAAISATTGVFTMDASMLAGEYAIAFAANNDALFVMAGVDVPVRHMDCRRRCLPCDLL